MKQHPAKTLDEELDALRLDIEPARDLWPGIARKLDRAPRRTRPMALAAAAALAGACVAGTISWAVLQGRAGRTPTTAAARVAPRAAARTAAFDEPITPRYVAARDSLEVSFRERLALLDPATRARVEASLEVIRHAHEDIRKALAADPASPVLEQLWQSTWHDELDLYERVVRSTQPAATRT
jgi:hypothetical protein